MSKTELLFRAVEALSTPAAKAVARGLTLWIGFNVLVVVFLVWRAWKTGGGANEHFIQKSPREGALQQS